MKYVVKKEFLKINEMSGAIQNQLVNFQSGISVLDGCLFYGDFVSTASSSFVFRKFEPAYHCQILPLFSLPITQMISSCNFILTLPTFAISATNIFLKAIHPVLTFIPLILLISVGMLLITVTKFSTILTTFPARLLRFQVCALTLARVLMGFVKSTLH